VVIVVRGGIGNFLRRVLRERQFGQQHEYTSEWKLGKGGPGGAGGAGE
jgi:hypothetical protein